jgi:hypothetical protein
VLPPRFIEVKKIPATMMLSPGIVVTAVASPTVRNALLNTAEPVASYLARKAY